MEHLTSTLLLGTLLSLPTNDTRLENLARDKHSSSFLARLYITNKKMFHNFGTGLQHMLSKVFTFHIFDQS